MALEAKRSVFIALWTASGETCVEKKTKFYPSHLPEDTSKTLPEHHLRFLKATIETMLRSKLSLSQRKASYSLYGMNCEHRRAKPGGHLQLGCSGRICR